MPELLFRAYHAYLSPGTRQTHAVAPKGPFGHLKITLLARNSQNHGKGEIKSTDRVVYD